jgi:hypothetical protein
MNGEHIVGGVRVAERGGDAWPEHGTQMTKAHAEVEAPTGPATANS